MVMSKKKKRLTFEIPTDKMMYLICIKIIWSRGNQGHIHETDLTHAENWSGMMGTWELSMFLFLCKFKNLHENKYARVLGEYGRVKPPD